MSVHQGRQTATQPGSRTHYGRADIKDTSRPHWVKKEARKSVKEERDSSEQTVANSLASLTFVSPERKCSLCFTGMNTRCFEIKQQPLVW